MKGRRGMAAKIMRGVLVTNRFVAQLITYLATEPRTPPFLFSKQYAEGWGRRIVINLAEKRRG
jgi:hypothetical protein